MAGGDKDPREGGRTAKFISLKSLHRGKGTVPRRIWTEKVVVEEPIRTLGTVEIKGKAASPGNGGCTCARERG